MIRPYSFKLCLACGIPKVTLEGTVPWKIGQNYILKLIETYKGEVDKEFWATIASKLFYGSEGPGNINGW